MHQQPPLQNLLTGGCVRLFGAPLGFEILHAVYVLSGATVALGLLHVMIRLGAHRAIAASFVVLYAVSPVTVFYGKLVILSRAGVAALHVLSLLALLRYYRLGTFGAGLTFFALLAASALFYSLFAPVLVFVGLALFVRPPLAADGRKAGSHETRRGPRDSAGSRRSLWTERGHGSSWPRAGRRGLLDEPRVKRSTTCGREKQGPSRARERREISRAPQLMLFSSPLSEYDKDLRIPHARDRESRCSNLEYAPDGVLERPRAREGAHRRVLLQRRALFLRHAPDASGGPS